MTPEQEKALAALAGDKYSDDPQQWIKIAKASLGKLGLRNRPPGTVLDIGAGFGYSLHLLAQWGWDVLAINPPDAIAYHQACEVLGIPYVQHAISEADLLPPGLLQYDLILQMHVNLWIYHDDDSATAALTNLARAMYGHLRPGGDILVRPNTGCCTERWCSVNFEAAIPGCLSHVERYDSTMHRQVWIRKPA